MNPRRVVWTRPSLQELRRLDRQAVERIREALGRLADSGHGDVRKLVGKGGPLALRVGDWRVWFDLDEQAGAIVVLHVRPRGRAYRD